MQGVKNPLGRLEGIPGIKSRHRNGDRTIIRFTDGTYFTFRGLNVETLRADAAAMHLKAKVLDNVIEELEAGEVV